MVQTVTETVPAQQPETALTQQVDALFAEWDRDDSPGCALGIVQGGKLVYGRGYGMANLDHGVPITPASVFHVASVSKQFTAISIGMLAHDGTLSLDDDVRAYVPELPDFGRTITIRHLIHHTSGLRDQYALFRLAGWRDEDTQSFEDVLEFAYAHRRLNFEPGSEYSYCNTSYSLMALIVERVSGQSLRDFARERIFEPLDMTHSHIHDDVTEIVPGRASGYAPRDGGFKLAESTVQAPGAICLYTAVEDLARWVRNFGDRQIAGAVLDDATTSGTLNDGTPVGYGFGLSVGTYRGLKKVGHGGVDSGYRAEVLWFPEPDFGVVILANLSTVKPGALARRVADIYLADQLGEDSLLDAPAVELSGDELAALAGLYRDERTGLTRSVQLQDGKLKVVGLFFEQLELIPLGDGRFRMGDPAGEVRIVPGTDGALEYRESSSNGFVNVYKATQAATPEPSTLAEYAGTYVCPDLGVRYTFAVRDGALALVRRKQKDCTLDPTVADAFHMPWFDIVFSRGGRGDVNGFDVFAERIRYLRFERER